MAAKKRSTAKRKTAARKSASSKRTARKSAARRQPSDAIALLKADHKLVKDLFDQFEKARNNDRKAKLAREICRELTVHAQIEEEILYPAAREVLREEDLVDEATVEHQSAKDLIAQIERSSAGADLFDAKVKVLGEYVDHHVKEEQNEMFPKLRKTRLDLKTLGERLMERKMALKGGGTQSRAASRSSGSRKSESLMTAMARTIGLS